MDPRRPIQLCTLILALLTAGSPVVAQSRATLTGRVVDADRNPMPGVTVSIASPTVAMAPAGTVTDARGRYRITALQPAGDYVVLAELPGFAKVEVSPVDLDPGKTTTLDFSLVPSTETTEKITVTGRGDIVDVASTKTATVFNSEFIEGLPLLGRSYQDILTLAPGVTDVDGDGNPNVNGARDTDFQTRVDGANTTDPVTGTFGSNLNLEAIAEIEIITTGASAEFSQAQGGFANIITKSGGNEFEGSFKFFFRSDMLDNDGTNNNDLTDTNLFSGLDGFTDIRPFLTLGGPFVRDRLWYFVALEWINLESPTNTLTTPVLTTQKGWNNFIKFSWQADSSHRLSLQVSNDPRRFTGLGLGTGIAPESDFIFDQGGNIWTTRWTYNISPTLLLETLVSRFETSIDVLPITEPEPCVVDSEGRCNPFTEDLLTFDTRQGTTNGPFYLTSRDTRTRDTFKTDLSIFLDTSTGSHNIKTGFEFAREGFSNQQDADPIRFDDFGASSVGIGVFEGSINFQESVPSSQLLKATKDNFGLYVQDSYKPLPNLSINVGLRFDREDARTDGFELFDPVDEAAEFLRLYSIGSGIPVEELGLYDAFADAAKIRFDINGDGLDDLHCRLYDLDGAAFGDGMPNGVSDDFWTYFDGDFDGLVTCDGSNPFDVCIQVPDGQADGISGNPLCDYASDDVFTLIGSYHRHQYDDTGDPFATLGVIIVDRDGDGIPAFCPENDPSCTKGEVLDPDDLGGEVRDPDDIRLVNNNFAPRLSVSWDPWANNRTKIFVTWSRFYDKLFLATIVPELGPDPRTTVYDPNQLSNGASATKVQTGRFSIIQVDRGMKTPFTDEFTIGFERELAPEWVFSFTYINRKGRDQLQDVDFNHYVQDLNDDGVFDDNFGRVGLIGSGPDDQGGGDGLQFATFAVAPDGQPDLFAYNPFFNQILRVGNFNTSAYESYQLTLTRRLSRQWQMTGSYVFSEAVGNAESFLSQLGNDPSTIENEFGPLSFDQTHRVILSGVSFLPGNQSVGATVEWTSGLPFSLILRKESADSFGSFFFRTSFPTQQRNDQRNEPRWLINLHYRKNFVFGRVNSSVGVEVENLLNSDDLRIFSVDQATFLGVNATRRFGRRWQLSAEFHF